MLLQLFFFLNFHFLVSGQVFFYGNGNDVAGGQDPFRFQSSPDAIVFPDAGSNPGSGSDYLDNLNAVDPDFRPPILGVAAGQESQLTSATVRILIFYAIALKLFTSVIYKCL
jgi:hypothetical protein